MAYFPAYQVQIFILPDIVRGCATSVLLAGGRSRARPARPDIGGNRVNLPALDSARKRSCDGGSAWGHAVSKADLALTSQVPSAAPPMLWHTTTLHQTHFLSHPRRRFSAASAATSVILDQGACSVMSATSQVRGKNLTPS